MGLELATASDAELLACIGAGDDPALALAALYDRYASMLLALALRIVRDRPEAEDVVHDAFLLVSNRARQYVAERGSVGAWIVTLVRNLSIDRTRRRDRRATIARDVLAHDPDLDSGFLSDDPENRAAASIERQRVLRALATLSAAQRSTLEVAFFEGLTYAEIAEREGVPIGTIKSRAARALAALRQAMNEETSR
ncbi:MAG: sigma-70 family RNA polymerase sigma factor [Myxococcota bacterium]|nr:sigma-70 family RNA polymerase sigma factor [Myxococcota bacterium]